jgi:membrane protease YdiL (CAAX protease family)
MRQEPHEAAPSIDDYWSRSREPLSSLAFLLPLLVVYELGVVWFAHPGVAPARNGADYWLRSALQEMGFELSTLLPLAITGFLLLWQAAGGYRWRVRLTTLGGMLSESLLLGACLVVAGQLQDLAFHSTTTPFLAAAQATVPDCFESRLIGFLGAGIYEEVLFRLCLLPVCAAAWRVLLVPARPALLLAILSTSLLFSWAHYIGPAADSFTAFGFVFRATAGAFFAAIFVCRGFGIAAGTHAAYDLLVGVVLAGA